jgi:hypothetical protein
VLFRSVLPKGALKDGLRKAPSHLNLPELPMFSIIAVLDDKTVNDARDVFVSYLEIELGHLGKGFGNVISVLQ